MGTGSILFSLFNDMFAYIAIKMTPLFHPESAETEYAENVFGSEGDAELLYMATLSLCIINQEGFGQYCTQAPKNGYDVIISDPPEIDPTVKKRTVIFNESTFTLESQWACHQVIADAFGKLSTTGRAYVLCPEQALFDIQTGIEINKVLVKYDLIELVIKLYDKWSLLIINKNKVKSKQGVIQYGHLKFPLQYIGFDLPKRTVFSEAVNSVKNMTTGAGSYAIVGIEEIRSRNYDLRPATYLNGSFADNYNDKTDTYSKINNLVKNGETEQIEFKGSVRLNVNKWIEGELDYKDDLAEKGVLKTIAGMLNKNGGKVIIGLLEASKYTDKPEKIANLPIIGNYLLLGIEEEEKWWKKGRDGYENALRDYIHSRISKAIPIEIGFIEYQNKNICCITIDKTDHEVWYYLDDSKYYVREGNSTREYTGRSADQYKKQHEKQST